MSFEEDNREPKMASIPVPFDIIRHAFILMAIIIVLSVLGTIFEVIKCSWLSSTTNAMIECRKLEVREFVLELLGVILVLMNVKKKE